MAAIPLSIVIGAPLAGILLEMDGTLGLAGWQWMFLIEGLPAVLLGFFVFFYLDDRPEQARWLTAEQKAWLSGKIRAEQNHARVQHRVGTVRSLAHPMVWALGLLSFVLQAGTYGLTFWIPQILKGLTGLSNVEIGLLSAIPYAGATVGMVLIGASSDRTGERFLHMAVPLFLAAIAFAVSALVSSPLPALVLFTIVAIGDYGCRGPFWSLPGRFLVGSAAAAGIAFINTLGALGGFAGAYAVGLLKTATGGFTAGLLLLGALLLAGAIAVLGMRGARTLAVRPA
jgi:ACS family tartrate transporter-like MFS transporter